MTTEEEEWPCHKLLLQKASGDVLIAGLGIGMVNRMIEHKVDSITVVEKHQEVIELIDNNLQLPKTSIIRTDFDEWIKIYQRMYDIIWIDLDRVFTDEEMKDYREKCKHLLKENGEVLFWYPNA